MTTSLRWREKYTGFPDLPDAKRWLNNGTPGNATQEQIISKKLLFNETITTKESNLLFDCTVYYKKLFRALNRFNFSKWSTSSIQDFLEYIGYAYNYLPLLTNEIELYKTFRLVENNDGVTKEFKHQLSYPPLDLVKEKNLFNRASSPHTTVFYSSEAIDTTFKELKPKIKSVVTLGIWEPINKNIFLSYPIMANPSAHKVNSNAKTASAAFSEIRKKNNPLLGQFMDGYFNVLNNEYSKTIKHKTEYLVSAYFSEKIFEQDEEGWNFDCIVYPSVGNNFERTNFAFKPNIVDSKLKLNSAIELEVLETYYDTPIINKNPLTLSVAKVRIIKQSKAIAEDGKIVWDKIGC